MFWEQIGLLALAVGLGTAIGAEREFNGKAAGMRTHALIALGAALFVMAGRYGFDIADDQLADPARIAAQIVSGIGFLGAGVIFVNRSLIHGMTTAASIWMTTAIAVACGAGLPLVAVAVTALGLAVVVGLTPVERFIGRYAHRTEHMRLVCESEAALASALALCTSRGFTITEVNAERSSEEVRTTEVSVTGRGSVSALTTILSRMEGVREVTIREE